MFASSVEHFLNQRAEFKRKLKKPDISEAERVYYKTQEAECKVLANSFYGIQLPIRAVLSYLATVGNRFPW